MKGNSIDFVGNPIEDIEVRIIREKQCLVRYSISRYAFMKVRKDPEFPKTLVIPALPGVKGFDVRKTDRYFGLSEE